MFKTEWRDLSLLDIAVREGLRSCASNDIKRGWVRRIIELTISWNLANNRLLYGLVRPIIS